MKLRQQAERVGQRLTKNRLHPEVLRAAAAKAAGTSWCVAVSGGADSVALLLCLWALWPERRPALIVLHFNHRTRGVSSNADERFCRRLGRSLGVKVIVGRRRTSKGSPSEAALRADRQAFFARALKKTGSRVLWLAHQRDDVAETLLMRLSRGSGTAGLSAPRPVQAMPDRVLFFRPLLSIAKTELRDVLEAAGVKWREDASNVSPQYFRNRIRSDVLPRWQQAAGRDAMAGAYLSRELLAEDDDALEWYADQLRAVRSRVLDVEACRGQPQAVLRRLLRRWLTQVCPETDLSRQGFSVLLACVRAGKPTRFSVGAGLAVIRKGELRFQRNR